MLRAIPLVAIIVVVYNGLAFAGRPAPSAVAYSATLPSGAPWSLTIGDVLICAGLVLLFLEIFKASLVSGASSLDHALSMVLFVVCLLEFILVRSCGTSVFMIITLLTFIDVIAGFSVSVAAARRDISVSD